MSEPRATCPECGQDVCVTPSGSIRPHRDHLVPAKHPASHWWRNRCPGSGEYPHLNYVPRQVNDAAEAQRAEAERIEKDERDWTDRFQIENAVLVTLLAAAHWPGWLTMDTLCAQVNCIADDPRRRRLFGEACQQLETSEHIRGARVLAPGSAEVHGYVETDYPMHAFRITTKGRDRVGSIACLYVREPSNPESSS